MDFKKYRKLPAPKRAEERYGFLHRVGVGFRRALPFLLLALSLCLMASVISSLRSSYWCYYTDDIGVRREAERQVHDARHELGHRLESILQAPAALVRQRHADDADEDGEQDQR